MCQIEDGSSQSTEQEESAMHVTTIGIDLAKNSFSVHGVDARGKTVLRQNVTRARLLSLLAQQPAALIGLEACSGAHHWAREFERLGHRVGIMAPRFVAPYRKGGKNDGNDAEAICEAVARPGMRFVPVKRAEQQAVLCLHRVRQGLIKERTAAINQLRGLLSEFGLVMPKGRYGAQRHIPRILEDAENGLPDLARRLLHDVYLRLHTMNEQLLAYDRELDALARGDDTARRLMSVPGVGAVSASALVASVGDPAQFRNGRAFAAWLGLTPRQYTTGGKIRLGRITKRGDVYLRTLLIHGTRAVLARVKDKPDRLSVWSRTLIERRGYKRAAVALAAKNARIVWAMMKHGTTYQLKPID
jgi:transposase